MKDELKSMNWGREGVRAISCIFGSNLELGTLNMEPLHSTRNGPSFRFPTIFPSMPAHLQKVRLHSPSLSKLETRNPQLETGFLCSAVRRFNGPADRPFRVY